jgi:hypothetical protein
LLNVMSQMTKVVFYNKFEGDWVLFANVTRIAQGFLRKGVDDAAKMKVVL